MTAPTRAETIAKGAAGHRRGAGCCSLSGQPNAGAKPAAADREDMVFLAGGNFLMGSNSFYREERPVRPAHVDGFWIDVYPVTNADFRQFVDATGYVTYSERPPNPAMYPDADPALLVPGSLVFKKPDRPVSLRDNLAWWEYKVGADWRHVEPPRFPAQEQVWEHTPRAGADGLGRAAILNPDIGDGRALGVELAWSHETLPRLFQWRVMSDQNYVVGLEPGNAPIEGRAHARESGTLVTLAPGEERRTSLRITLHGDADGLAGARERIAACTA